MHETFLAPETHEKGPRSARTVGRHYETAKNGPFVSRNGLGYRQVRFISYLPEGMILTMVKKMYYCWLLPSGGESQRHWGVYEHSNRSESSSRFLIAVGRN